MITPEVARSMEESVLCWLATVSETGVPNVSPKEAFLHDGQGRILVANIASPVTVKNIEAVEQVCISFVNVFVQKGYKIQGRARVYRSGETGFEERHGKLTEKIGTRFPILSVIEIEPKSIAEIIAPSYRLYPESREEDRIRESWEAYQVEKYERQTNERDQA